MYSDEKKKIALNLLKETKSVTKTIRILGYPTIFVKITISKI